MEFNAFLLTLARVNLKPGVSLQPSVVAAILQLFCTIKKVQEVIFAHFAKEKKFSQFCRKPNASRLEEGNDTNYLEFSEDKSNTHLHSVH